MTLCQLLLCFMLLVGQLFTPFIQLFLHLGEACDTFLCKPCPSLFQLCAEFSVQLGLTTLALCLPVEQLSLELVALAAYVLGKRTKLCRVICPQCSQRFVHLEHAGVKVIKQIIPSLEYFFGDEDQRLTMFFSQALDIKKVGDEFFQFSRLLLNCLLMLLQLLIVFR
ncbi:hypothetical protein D3C78_1206320 [compost metagenome]